MRCVSFKVSGKPPKKDSGKSMWSHCEVKLLREIDWGARETAGLNETFKGKVTLIVSIYDYKNSTESKADLDNLVGGICDGLQGSPDEYKKEDLFEGKPILFEDDCQVVRIIAERRETEEPTYYIVTVIEETCSF